MGNDSSVMLILMLLAAVVAVWLAMIAVAKWVIAEIVSPTIRTVTAWLLRKAYLRDPDDFADWLEDWALQNSSVPVDPNDDVDTVVAKHLPNLHEAVVQWFQSPVSWVYWAIRVLPPSGVCLYFVLHAPRELLGLAGGLFLFVAVMTFVFMGDTLLPKFSSERK